MRANLNILSDEHPKKKKKAVGLSTTFVTRKGISIDNFWDLAGGKDEQDPLAMKKDIFPTT